MAARAALYNVLINLGSIKDSIFTETLKREADKLAAAAETKEKELLSSVNAKFDVHKL